MSSTCSKDANVVDVEDDEDVLQDDEEGDKGSQGKGRVRDDEGCVKGKAQRRRKRKRNGNDTDDMAAELNRVGRNGRFERARFQGGVELVSGNLEIRFLCDSFSEVIFWGVGKRD